MPSNTTTRDKCFLTSAVTIGIVAAFFVYWSEQTFTIEVPPQLSAPRSRQASLLLDFGDGKRREFRGEVAPSMTVMEALALSADAGRIALDYKPSGTGVEVSEINGKRVEQKKGWVFYVNGQRGGNPLTYLVQPGDAIEWRYE